jgi:hypothetical protein
MWWGVERWNTTKDDETNELKKKRRRNNRSVDVSTIMTGLLTSDMGASNASGRCSTELSAS